MKKPVRPISAHRSPSLLFITQRYWPSHRATAQLVTDLAEGLAEHGFDVEVVCEAESSTALLREEHAGVNVRRIRIAGHSSQSIASRALAAVAFYFGVLRVLLTGHRADLVIFLTAPPFLSVLGLVAKTLRGQPYGVWSHDLHPEAEIVHGLLSKSGILTSLFERADGDSYRGGEFVVDLGRCMRNRIERRGVDPRRSETIPVWSRQQDVTQIPHSENPLRSQLGLGDRFVVMYSGNAGIAHCFEEVLEVADRLKNDEAFFFLFVGGGARRGEIERFVEERGIRNFRYMDYFPRADIGRSLSVADVHLITLRPQMSGIAVPSKVSGIMGVGRPIVMVGSPDSEVSQMIMEAKCGMVVEPGQSDSSDRLESALRRLASDEALSETCSGNARRYFLDYLTMDAGLLKWRRLLESHFS